MRQKLWRDPVGESEESEGATGTELTAWCSVC